MRSSLITEADKHLKDKPCSILRQSMQSHNLFSCTTRKYLIFWTYFGLRNRVIYSNYLSIDIVVIEKKVY